jgi:excisionase family DNA binding protein
MKQLTGCRRVPSATVPASQQEVEGMTRLADKEFPFYSPGEVADALGFSLAYIYRRLRRGELKGRRIGRAIFIARDDIQAMLEGAPDCREAQTSGRRTRRVPAVQAAAAPVT